MRVLLLFSSSLHGRPLLASWDLKMDIHANWSSLNFMSDEKPYHVSDIWCSKPWPCPGYLLHKASSIWRLIFDSNVWIFCELNKISSDCNAFDDFINGKKNQKIIHYFPFHSTSVLVKTKFNKIWNDFYC